jgi:hypothetical protein
MGNKSKDIEETLLIYRLSSFKDEKLISTVILKLLTEHHFSSILLWLEHIPDEYSDTTLENSKKETKESHWPSVLTWFDLDKLNYQLLTVRN